MKLVVQPKLLVGSVDDPHEREADRVADEVVASVGRRLDGDLSDGGVATPDSTRIRRAASSVGAAGGAIDADTESAIASARSGGRPLDGTLLRTMGSAIGADFSGIRVHVDAQSDELNRRIEARAFTSGSDIFVRRADYAPGTLEGQHLLAHELAHTVQQGAAPTHDSATGESSRVGDGVQRSPTRIRRFEGAQPVVRRLVSGTALREEIGGPSSNSNTYRKLIKDLDAYDAVLSRPRKADGDNKSLLTESRTIEELLRGVVLSCDAFLSGHKKDKRAGRVAGIKADAQRDQAALRLRTAELGRGTRPTWASWKEALNSTAETTTRDIEAEGGLAVGGASGNMNDVTKIKFGPKIGARGRASALDFFKADKESAEGLEENYGSGIGIPLGAATDRTVMSRGEHDLSGPRFAQRAVATSRIDKLLNANVIATTQLAVHNSRDGKVRGQIMSGAKGKTAHSFKRDIETGLAPGSDIDDPDLQRMLSKLDLVDSLCGQIDRHGGNFFIDRDAKTGKVTSVTGIDNDMAFGTTNFIPGQTREENVQYAGVGKYIDQETGEAILKLTGQDLQIVLGDLLLPHEIEAAIDRLLTTQQVIRKAKDEGRLIGPKGWGAATTGTGGAQYGIKVASGYHADFFHQK